METKTLAAAFALALMQCCNAFRPTTSLLIQGNPRTQIRTNLQLVTFILQIATILHVSSSTTILSACVCNFTLCLSFSIRVLAPASFSLIYSPVTDHSHSNDGPFLSASLAFLSSFLPHSHTYTQLPHFSHLLPCT